MRCDLTYPVDAILLLGPTGAGKSPLGDRLSRSGLWERRAHHLDFGHALRSAASGSEAVPLPYTSDERLFIRRVLEHGLLLENEHFPLARKIIANTLARLDFQNSDLLVLNGIPRHAGQAADVASIATIHALAVLECSADTVYCRLRENIGGDRGVREDDGAELVRRKLALFSERTQPLIEHYGRHGSKVYRLAVNDRTSVDEAFHQLSSLAAGDPPVALVTEPPQR